MSKTFFVFFYLTEPCVEDIENNEMIIIFFIKMLKSFQLENIIKYENKRLERQAQCTSDETQIHLI